MADISAPVRDPGLLAAGAAGETSPTADGLERVRVEVEPNPAFRGATGPADLLERFTDRVDELGASINGIAQRIRVALEADGAPAESGPWPMSNVAIEFGLNLEAETGLVVCKGKAAATFKVTVTLSRGEWHPA